VLEEMGIDVLSVSDNGRIKYVFTLKVIEKMEEQYIADNKIEGDILW
jgi:hypothetical protein